MSHYGKSVTGAIWNPCHANVNVGTSELLKPFDYEPSKIYFGEVLNKRSTSGEGGDVHVEVVEV